MKKSSPTVTVSKLSNKGNYTLSLAKLINIFNWLKLSIMSLTTTDLYFGLLLIYLFIMLAVISRLIGGA